jgi:hypothetical protein
MKTQNKLTATIKLLTLALALTLSLAGGSQANPNSSSAEKQSLGCRVMGNNIKQVMVTNHTDRVISKGTLIKFDGSVGDKTSTTMPKNLKPGSTAIVYNGYFEGRVCQCQIKQK